MWKIVIAPLRERGGLDVVSLYFQNLFRDKKMWNKNLRQALSVALKEEKARLQRDWMTEKFRQRAKPLLANGKLFSS